MNFPLVAGGLWGAANGENLLATWVIIKKRDGYRITYLAVSVPFFVPEI